MLHINIHTTRIVLQATGHYLLGIFEHFSELLCIFYTHSIVNGIIMIAVQHSLQSYHEYPSS